ncbi:MAG: tRNA (guanosine(46)-N7)-methyltransferase TrmB [Gammaproteobacteria bacterium]
MSVEQLENRTPAVLRTVRSFVRREGRMTKAQRKALTESWSRYGIDCKNQIIDLDEIFQRSAPRILEIGFGMGESLLESAINNQQKNFIGVDVYKPGVGKLLCELESHNIQNVRVINEDVVTVLEQMISGHSIDAVRIFFPDPWPKKRHHKRRLIQPEFISLLGSKLVKGGIVHLATDWQDYAQHMIEVLSSCKQFENVSEDGDYIPRPEDRPQTKFEHRGHRLGHGVWDIKYRYHGPVRVYG